METRKYASPELEKVEYQAEDVLNVSPGNTEPTADPNQPATTPEEEFE